MVFSIIAAGILVGVQTYPSMADNPIISVMDVIIQCIFTSDCVLKISREGVHPRQYLFGPERGWNNFDFWLVLICWIPLPGVNVAFLRLLRLMRLLKLVGKVKQLKIIVTGLLNGLASVKYILLLMFLIFYIFAILGMGMMRRNDPRHFGSLGITMLTLFRISTLENWSSILNINSRGCNSQYDGVDGVYVGSDGNPPYGAPPGGLGGVAARDSFFTTVAGDLPTNECWHPKRQPVLSAIYFLFFVLLSAFVCLSLFIGAVCGGMVSSLEVFKVAEAKEQAETKKRLAAQAAKESGVSSNGRSLDDLRSTFESYDEDG